MTERWFNAGSARGHLHGEKKEAKKIQRKKTNKKQKT